MNLMEIGRLCIKTKGRDAGSIAAIVDVQQGNYVVIEGPKARKRKCNAKHLLFTDRKISIRKNAPREEIMQKISDETVVK